MPQQHAGAALASPSAATPALAPATPCVPLLLPLLLPPPPPPPHTLCRASSGSARLQPSASLRPLLRLLCHFPSLRFAAAAPAAAAALAAAAAASPKIQSARYCASRAETKHGAGDFLALARSRAPVAAFAPPDTQTHSASRRPAPAPPPPPVPRALAHLRFSGAYDALSTSYSLTVWALSRSKVAASRTSTSCPPPVTRYRPQCDTSTLVTGALVSSVRATEPVRRSHTLRAGGGWLGGVGGEGVREGGGGCVGSQVLEAGVCRAQWRLRTRCPHPRRHPRRLPRRLPRRPPPSAHSTLGLSP